MVQMYQKGKLGGGEANTEHYETWEIKECYVCKRVAKEYYSVKVLDKEELEKIIRDKEELCSKLNNTTKS